MGNCGCRKTKESPVVHPYFPEEGTEKKTGGEQSANSDAVNSTTVDGSNGSPRTNSKRKDGTNENGDPPLFTSDTSRNSNASIGSRNSGNGITSSRSNSRAAFGHSDDLRSAPPGATNKQFPKRPMGCKLSVEAWHKIETLFRHMDVDARNSVTKVEAAAFFKGSFGKLSAEAMFNEVDVDHSGAITADEFVAFWQQVRKAGYKEEEIVEVLDELVEGGSWVDWNDGRDTDSHAVITFPKRPFLCRLSQKCWAKCEELFKKIDHDGSLSITRDKALKHFSGSFKTLAADAMFNEVDVNNHGAITPKEWMAFWVQVRWSGYKEQDIIDEVDSMIEGNPWVDWKDGRQT